MADNDSLNPLLNDHDRKPPEEQDSSSGGSYKPPPIHTAEPSSSSNPLSSSSSTNPPPSSSTNPPPLHPSSSLLSPPSSSSSSKSVIPPKPPVLPLPPIPSLPSNQQLPVSSPSSDPNQSLKRTTSEASLPLQQRLYTAGQGRWFHTIEDAKKYAFPSIKIESSAEDKFLAAVMRRAAADKEAKRVATAAAAEAAAAAARQATIEQRKRLYDQAIVPLEPGHVFKIAGYSALDPLRDLVKEKEELNNHVLGIFNSGRGLKYEICMILAGTVTLGLLSAIMKALLADKVSTLEKWSVLGVFSFAFLLSVSATIYELYRVYEPLVDAHASRATLIRRMNLVRDSLAAPESEVTGERLGEEHPLNKTLKEFCDKITGPLPIGWQKCSCFIQVGSLILIIIVAFIFMALTPPPSKHDGCHCGTGS